MLMKDLLRVHILSFFIINALPSLAFPYHSLFTRRQGKAPQLREQLLGLRLRPSSSSSLLRPRLSLLLSCKSEEESLTDYHDHDYDVISSGHNVNQQQHPQQHQQQLQQQLQQHQVSPVASCDQGRDGGGRVVFLKSLESDSTKTTYSRRDMIQTTTGMTAAAFIAPFFLARSIEPCQATIVPPTSSSLPSLSSPSSTILPASNSTLEPIDITKVLEENKINIKVTDKQTKSQIYINQTSYEKIITPYTPRWIPSWVKETLQRERTKTESISDYKLLTASIAAGSVTEIIRSFVLYPITTIKSRVQYKPPTTSSLLMKYEEFTSFLNSLSDSSSMNKIQLQQQEMQNVTTTNISSPTSTTTRTSFGIPHNIKITNLYAGIIPFLIGAVPSSGVYFGIRDVSKSEIIKSIELSSSTPSWSSPLTSLDDLSITLLSVFLGDVFSLAIKTPTLAFSVRRQVATNEEVEQEDNADDPLLLSDSFVHNSANSVDETNYFIQQSNNTTETTLIQDRMNSVNGNKSKNNHKISSPWWEEILKDSWKQLPIIILTDLPYLFLKISLLRIFATGHENIAEYTLLNTVLSCVCAVVTTPFDVARTRILVDSNGDPSDGLDGGLIVRDDYSERGGSLGNILYTMKMIVKEGSYGDDHTSSNSSVRSGISSIESDSGSYDLAGIQNLFAGWYERILYLGISIAWFDSIRILGYVGIRDIILLELFK